MKHRQEDTIFMERCLMLAQRGIGNVAPNPMVGAVIVYNGKIIGEGYHQKYGQAHAEVNAINSVKDKGLLSAPTIYVSLEPCSHYGKTPPCSLLIIKYKIPKVVIACSDSFDAVNGKGIEALKAAGCQVVLGVLEKEARELNRRFFTFHKYKRPYIILKWAQTLDGFIDFERTAETPIQPNWITDKYARILVHKWRAEEAAIMVATNTAQKDNPKLNVRDWEGKSPVRFVLDKSLRLDKSLSLFDQTVPTYVFSELAVSHASSNCNYIVTKFAENLLVTVFKEMYYQGLQSVIIEGGAYFLNSLIKSDLWDEARVMTGEKLFYKGVAAPRLMQAPIEIVQKGINKLLFYRNQTNCL